ncbi:protein of unknown function (plasmid) [Cupriavidus taiwanensis]|uniref:Uncharacterized protein n=1 Tax=Cupriavidus taiwanensis TaxID=164546 RepID=A0A375ING4_9BURK|nr:protein of unknown function [Cupriavidus taiwanensis]
MPWSDAGQFAAILAKRKLSIISWSLNKNV